MNPYPSSLNLLLRFDRDNAGHSSIRPQVIFLGGCCSNRRPTCAGVISLAPLGPTSDSGHAKGCSQPHSAGRHSGADIAMDSSLHPRLPYCLQKAPIFSLWQRLFPIRWARERLLVEIPSLTRCLLFRQRAQVPFSSLHIRYSTSVLQLHERTMITTATTATSASSALIEPK